MSSLYHCKTPNFCVSLHPSFSSSPSMEVSFLQHISTTTITTSSPQSNLSLLPRCSLSPKLPSRPGFRRKTPSKPILPRDRIIMFGKHNGKRLGTLPSSYLKWVAKSLKKTQFENWALLADEVLNDPVYGDRIEWEYVQRIMEGDFGSSRFREHPSDDIVADIHEIAEKFDWDMEDDVGWSKVDLALLGTSDGGRIPRKKEGKDWLSAREKFSEAEEAAAIGGDRRRERRERRRERERQLGEWDWGGERAAVVERHGVLGVTTEEDGGDEAALAKSLYPTLKQIGGSFPGRESLFKKVINNRKRSSS